MPGEGVARTPTGAVELADKMGFPVVLKIVSPDILHKTEAGGVLVGLKSAADVERGYLTIVENAKKYDPNANIVGVQVQQMITGGQEVIIGAVTDPSFGKLVAFGLGGVLVEVLKDITFRMAPASQEDALSMLDGIAAAEVLKGVRGADPANREALADMIQRVSELVSDFPEISELDARLSGCAGTGMGTGPRPASVRAAVSAAGSGRRCRAAGCARPPGAMRCMPRRIPCAGGG